MIMRIADQEVAIAIDAQAAGPTIAVVRRRPTDVEIIPVTIVALDPRRKIDDIEVVVGIDGDGTGAVNCSRLGAVFAPDNFRFCVRSAAAGREEQTPDGKPTPNRAPAGHSLHRRGHLNGASQRGSLARDRERMSPYSQVETLPRK